MPRATCPTQPDTHRRFVTVAHVSEDWLVDRDGNFIEKVASLETVAAPQAGNVWACADCGAEALVEG